MDTQANRVSRAEATEHHTVHPRTVSACPEIVASHETKGFPELINDVFCYFRNSVLHISLLV